MRRTPPLAHLMLALLIFLSAGPACTRKSSSEPGGEPGGRPRGGARVVNLAVWSNYMSPELLQEFERRTGIHVNVSNYSSNEELLAKLQAGAAGYDVAVPSDYMVLAMSKLGLIRALDRSKIPNARNLDPLYLGKSFDPANAYSLPYDWGTTGIAVNRELFKGTIKGWRDLFNNPELAGKFTLLDDVRETVGAALKAQGFSLNSRDPGELKKAKELLERNRARVKGYTSEPLMPLTNGETAVAHAYSSDALQARRATGGKIDFILPEEGGTMWIDNLVIPAKAPDVAEAHAFIDFLLDPASSASTTRAVLVAPSNKGAIALLPADIRDNPMLFPPKALLARHEMIQDLGEALAAYDRLWTEVKAGQ